MHGCLAQHTETRPPAVTRPTYLYARLQKRAEGIIGPLFFIPTMARLHLSTAAHLRRFALMAELPACGRALRALHTRRHGIPTAFVSLSGVTAMLSAAVRMA